MCDQATLEAWGVQAGGLGGNLRWEIQQDLILLLGCMATDYQSLKSSFDLQGTVETQKIDIQRVSMPPGGFSCAAFDTKCIQPTDFFLNSDGCPNLSPRTPHNHLRAATTTAMGVFKRFRKIGFSTGMGSLCMPCHPFESCNEVIRDWDFGSRHCNCFMAMLRCYLPELGWYRFPSRRPVPSGFRCPRLPSSP